MPIGCTSLIPYIAQDLFRRRPSSVLDLGMGYGLYGAVVRNYCGDLEPGATRRTRVTGVERFQAYRNPLWDLYDEIDNGFIEGFLCRTQPLTWDVILLMDVIEHFDKQIGQGYILPELRKRVSPGGVLWVGTPGIYQEQGAVFGNELECHRCLWTADNLQAAGLQIVLDGSRDVHGNQMLLARHDG